MGFPAYLLGLSVPLLGGLALGFLVLKMMQEEQPQKEHRHYSYNSRPNWEYANPKTANSIVVQNNSDDCPVCFDPMEAGNSQKFACGHRLHLTCLVEMSQRNMNSCPQCRAKIY